MGALAKPAYGAPCNGCGECCLEEPCVLAQAVLRIRQDSGSCPALVKTGATWSCGMLLEPARFAPVRAAIHGEESLRTAAQYLIGSGIGCDAQYVDEPSNPAFKVKLQNLRTDAAIAALMLWVGAGRPA